jgi:hypothetical protein
MYDLERRAGTIDAAVCRRAIEIAGGIEQQAAVGIEPVRSSVVEAIKNPLTPGPVRHGSQLEDCTDTIGPATAGSSIEIAGGIEDQRPARRLSTVRAAEIVEDRTHTLAG